MTDKKRPHAAEIDHGFIYIFSPGRRARPKLSLEENTADNCPLCDHAIRNDMIRKVYTGWVETKNAFPAIADESLLMPTAHNGTTEIGEPDIGALLSVSHCHERQIAYSCTAASIPGHFHANAIPGELPIFRAESFGFTPDYSITSHYPGRCIVVNEANLRKQIDLVYHLTQILRSHEVRFNMVIGHEKVFVQPVDAFAILSADKVVSGRELAGVWSTSCPDRFAQMNGNDAEFSRRLRKSSLKPGGLKAYASLAQKAVDGAGA